MKAKGIFTVARNALVPQDERAQEIMGKLKIGDRLLVSVHKARNPEHDRLVHKIYDLIAEAKGVSPEKVKFWLKVETGHVHFEQTLDGKWGIIPDDFRFTALGQEEFQEYWNHAVPIIQEKILPDAPPEIYQQIRNIIAGKA